MPGWILGVIFAELSWGLTLFGAYFFEFVEPLFPQWMDWFDIPDTLGSICAFIAAPVAVGGWLLVWGDNGPPYPWLESWQFNVAFGAFFYGLLGAAMGYAATVQRRHSMPSALGKTRNKH